MRASSPPPHPSPASGGGCRLSPRRQCADKHASEGMPLIRIIAAVATLLAAAAPAPAQDWPTRPVTIIVPFAAGGAFDVMARVFSPHLTQILGQQVYRRERRRGG